MKLVLLILMGIYLAVMLVVGILDYRRTKEYTEYAVAGRRQGTLSVVMTLLATIFGASTTIGICDTVYSIGFPGIWWLLFGALGLVLQSLFLSERIRRIHADTLPHLAEVTVGKAASVLLAGLIVISWIGVIAGQMVAMHSLITYATGNNSKTLLILISLVVILYTALGGQLSVVKTDKLQLVVILAGLLICCGYLYLSTDGAAENAVNQVELLNGSYGGMDLLNSFFIIGGVYFLGPDILSRNFLSKDEKTAKRSAWIAGLVMAFFALVITCIGIWARNYMTAEQLGDQKVLLAVAGILPKGISLLLSLGLLSAILSSTDTCIVNAATILSRDILGRKRVGVIRASVVGIGILSLLIAVLGNGNIISILTGAYSIYTPGVIFPLLIAVLAYGKRPIHRGLWITAVILGGCFGLAGTFLSEWLSSIGLPSFLVSHLSLMGMGFSLILSLISLWMGRKKAE